ncbi:hypothetical protein [Alteromonas sp. D210916BOD_24]|uniref:hypothetical protein n=1 Tax=Alteromonas sp. D210916BOD_24 TaxID=3157618 RepID=UPI00399CABD1
MCAVILPCTLLAKKSSALTQTAGTEQSTINQTFKHLLSENQVVAIGDIHGSSAPTELLINVLSDSDIFESIDVIVTEFGNSHYQTELDDFLLNPNTTVSLQDLEPLWQDSIYFMAWQYEHYRHFVQTLKLLNASSNHTVRIVLAEPEFSWEGLTREQWRALTKTRIASYEHTVKQVAENNDKAILLFGAMHTLKQPVTLKRGEAFAEFVPFITNLNELNIATIWTHFSTSTIPDISPQTLVLLNEKSDLDTPFSHLSARFSGDDNQKLSDVADAYYYPGPLDRHAPAPSHITQDSQWHDEMKRRAAIVDERVSSQIAKQLAEWLAETN